MFKGRQIFYWFTLLILSGLFIACSPTTNEVPFEESVPDEWILMGGTPFSTVQSEDGPTPTPRPDEVADADIPPTITVAAGFVVPTPRPATSGTSGQGGGSGGGGADKDVTEGGAAADECKFDECETEDVEGEGGGADDTKTEGGGSGTASGGSSSSGSADGGTSGNTGGGTGGGTAPEDKTTPTPIWPTATAIPKPDQPPAGGGNNDGSGDGTGGGNTGSGNTGGPTATPRATREPRPTTGPRPTEGPRPTRTPLPPTPTLVPVMGNAPSFPESPVYTSFDADLLIRMVGITRDSFRSFTLDWVPILTDQRERNRGDCGSYLGWYTHWVTEAPVFTEVPAAWENLYVRYRIELKDAVGTTNIVRRQCPGVFVDPGFDPRAGTNPVDWFPPALARMENIVIEANSLPR